MNHFWHASAGCFLILATLAGSGYSGGQQGQTGDQSSSSGPRLSEVTVRFLGDDVQKRAYENIEIFRRLLLKTLTPFTSDTKANNSGDYYSRSYSQASQAYYRNFQKANDPHASVGIGPLPVEGVLLPSGIVMTAELPGAFSLPAKESESKVKPLTDWDRAQRELNGEKIDQAADAKPVHKPNVLDAVLHTLAENGHKLSGLDANQGVTLVLTFRGAWSQQCTACHASVTQTSTQTDFDRSNTLSVDLANTLLDSGKDAATGTQQASSQLLLESMNRIGGQNKADGQNYGLASDTNDQILGDLHFKQGRYQEALACYAKALKEHYGALPEFLNRLPKGADSRRRESILHAIELQNKVVQCEMALKHEDKVDHGVSTLKRWMSLLEGMEEHAGNQQAEKGAQAKKKGQPLPVKAIITASKKLLDQVGEGQITFDQFKMKVDVNIVRFE